MNRTDFQQLAELRNEEAGILLAQGKSDGAYYLAGYAVECALKACIAKLTREFDFPDKRFAEKCFVHKIERLVECANLESARNAMIAANRSFANHMTLVAEWNEESRYQRKTLAEAQQLYDAINDPQDGVYAWLKLHW